MTDDGERANGCQSLMQEYQAGNAPLAECGIASNKRTKPGALSLTFLSIWLVARVSASGMQGAHPTTMKRGFKAKETACNVFYQTRTVLMCLEPWLALNWPGWWQKLRHHRQHRQARWAET